MEIVSGMILRLKNMLTTFIRTGAVKVSTPSARITIPNSALGFALTTVAMRSGVAVTVEKYGRGKWKFDTQAGQAYTLRMRKGK